MTRALETALAEIAELPPDEQDALAAMLLEEIKSERRWAEWFQKSQPQLETLAAEAIAEFKAGKTKPLEDLL